MSSVTYAPLAVAAMTLGLAAPSVQGQSGAASTPSGTPVMESAAVVVDSTMTTVGFALHVPMSSGPAGLANLVSLTLQDVLQDQVSGLAARLRVDVDPAGVLISTQSTSDALPELIRAVQRAAFEEPLGAARVGISRTAVLAQLTFESGAPVRTFEREARRVIFGEFAPWRELTSGTRQSVERLSAEEIGGSPPFDAAARRSATAAVVGPVVPEDARELLDGLLASSPTSPSRGSNLPSAEHAWTSGDTHTIPAEITRTWVAVAIPLRAELATWKQHLLTHHVREALMANSPNAELVSPQVTLLQLGDFPVVYITFATFAETAQAAAERTIATVRLEIDAPADDRFFEWTRRRFRNSWLLANTSSEARAQTIATDLQRSQSVASRAAIPSSLSRADLEDGARGLGEPRVVIYGPTLELPEEP